MFPAMKYLVPVLALCGLFPAHLSALGGSGAAPINEAAISVTLYVNPTAPAGGSGTQSSPFNTIQAALNRAINTHNAANQGVRVLLAPGIYREGIPGATSAITLPTPTTAAPVIIQGAGWNPSAPANTGDVIISGSENWSGGWTAQGNGTWTRAWPYTWGVGPNNTGGGNPPETMLRYELVHVNGVTYYQMLGPSDPNLANLTATEGAFWVNEATSTITIRPPATLTDLNSALVEVTTKRRLLHHWRAQAITTPTNVVLRNLVFQHSASGLNSGAVFLQNMIGLHVEDCVFRDNKQMGLSIGGINSVFTIRRTDVIRNGEMGSGLQGVNILAEDVRWNDNSRFADVVQYYGWGYGGVKIGNSSNLTFRRIEAARNYGMGLWFDTGNVNCLVTDSVIVDNTSQGVWSENNNRNNIPALGTTPTVVLRRVYLAGNYKRSPQATATGGGFYITEAENSVIENSVLYDNDIQFRISDGPGRGPTANTTVRSSVLASRQGQVQRLYATGYGTTGWQQFFDTLSSATGNNDYYYSGSTDGVTALTPQPQPASTLAFYTRDQQLTQTLANWKTLHASRGADQDSRWITSYNGQPLVAVEAVAAYRQETGGTVDGWIVRRVARDFSTALTVSLSSGGTATPGVHYQPLPGSVVIPAGSREVVVPFTPIITGQSYGELTVALVIASSSAYVAPSNSASFILEDATSAGLPRITVTATAPIASETGPTAGEFTLTRTGSTTGPLTVNYSVGGTAAPSRYQPLSGQAVFAAGSPTAVVRVEPIDDATPQLSQTVVLTIVAGTGYVPSTAGSVSATVTLRDNDIAQPVNVTLPSGTNTVVVPVTLNNPANVAQTFTVSLPSTMSSAYIWDDSTQSGGPAYEWINIHAIPGRTEITELRGQDDAITQFANGQSGATGGIPLGFNFPFFTGVYSNLRMSSNGVLYFGAGNLSAPWQNVALPSNTLVNGQPGVAALAFFWDDLKLFESPTPASRAYYARPDANTFVVTVENFRHYANNSLRFTAQVVLKSDGEIRVNYQNVTIPYNLGSTIGLQGTQTEGSPVVQVSFNNDYVRSGMSLRFRPPTRWLSAAQNTFQVVVPAGSSSSFDLTLSAAGLALGSQTATLRVTSNHPDQPEITLPVTLNIADAAPPSAPGSLVATSVTFSSIGLAWNDLSTTETGFRVERASSLSGPWSTVATLAADTTTHTDTGLSASTTYHYRVIAFNAYGDSGASNVLTATTNVATDVPPSFTDASTLDIVAGQPFSRLIRLDQEIRAFFDEPAADTYPATAGAGWLDGWTIRATSIDTTTSAALVFDNPIQNSGPNLRLTATAGGTGNKRAFLTRAYGDDPVRRLNRAAPHRIVLELRADDISGFANTSDRLYVWDRPVPSNADHLNNTDHTWAFLTNGTNREWSYYAGTTLTTTGVRLVQGRTYRFNVEVDPAQRRWRFTLRNLDWQSGDAGAASHSSAWVAFRNSATGAASVGGQLHVGAFLASLQTVRLSLDSVRITAPDLSFASGTLPAGVTFDSEIGRISGTIASGSGVIPIAATHLYGTTWRNYAYALSTPYELWTAANPTFAALPAEQRAPLADPDGDGIPNLLEYALGTDPASASDRPEVIVDTSGNHLTLSFTPENIAGVRFIIEASSDLSDWSQTEDVTDLLTAGQPYTHQDSADLSTNPRRFLRLRVSAP
jgi:hypothetical protein